MSFKLIVLCASLAVISCAHIDSSREQFEAQNQQIEDLQRRNEELREREHEEIQLQQQQLEDQRRQQEENRREFEQRLRDEEQERRDRLQENRNENRYDNRHNNRYDNRNDARVYHHQQRIPAFITFQPALVQIPQSRNAYDDSSYNFEYRVTDPSTGDVKSHQETRRGDQVQGQYKLMDSDGYERIVNYRANDQDGFDAVVRREPTLTTLVQHHQQQQNYADRHQNRHSYNYHPSVYTSQSFNRNDDGRRH
jgi:hypothetical protein